MLFFVLCIFIICRISIYWGKYIERSDIHSHRRIFYHLKSARFEIAKRNRTRKTKSAKKKLNRQKWMKNEMKKKSEKRFVRRQRLHRQRRRWSSERPVERKSTSKITTHRNKRRRRKKRGGSGGGEKNRNKRIHRRPHEPIDIRASTILMYGKIFSFYADQ